MSDYLWDKEGPPDAEVEELEQLLAPLAYRGPAPTPPPPRPRRPRGLWITAGALAVSAIAAIVLLLRPRPPRSEAVVAGWTVRVQGGTANLGGRAITGEARLPVASWLETGASRVELTIGTAGTVMLAPGARARILQIGGTVSVGQMELARGSMSAHISAPPRSFAVHTSHVTAIDLGCAFTLAVDETAGGRLIVTEGAVALADGTGREVAVPAGAECAFDEHGPALPFASDATPAFREAMARLGRDPSALRALIAEARAADLPSLKLLASANTELRALIDKRIGELEHPAPAPPAKTKHAVKHGAAKSVKPSATPPATIVPKATAPAQKPPAQKPAQRPGLRHDALQDLERSSQ
jgi:hypothetical protein